jgi:hypothetical protein
MDDVPAWLSYGPVDLHAVRKEMRRVVLRLATENFES